MLYGNITLLNLSDTTSDSVSQRVYCSAGVSPANFGGLRLTLMLFVDTQEEGVRGSEGVPTSVP